MTLPPFRRPALAFSAAAFLAGCGGSQPPVGAPGAMAQTSAITTHAERGTSWILTEAKSEDLLYASGGYASQGCSAVCVYSYPRGKLVGELSIYDTTSGVCSDKAGDLFVATDSGYGDIYEYAHGGTTPIATLSDPTGEAFGCSVDPTTGDLAVTNQSGYSSGPGDVMIYKHASGEPKVYSDYPNILIMGFCGYDNRGDLFIDGLNNQSLTFALAELPKHGRKFITVKLDQNIDGAAGVQWHNGRLAVGNGSGPNGFSMIYEFRISGSEGKEVRSTPLQDSQGLGAFWIQDRTVVGVNKFHDGKIRFWKYPSGGSPTMIIKDSPGGDVAVSVASGS